MRKVKSSLVLALTTICIFSSLARSDYSILSDDTDYDSTKYRQWGLINALDDMHVSQLGYWWSSAQDFWEDGLIPWYINSSGDVPYADRSRLTIIDGPAGTFPDYSTNSHYFTIGARYWWNGTQRVSNQSKFGAPLRLGESYGLNPGRCRYFMALGNNTVAAGPPSFSKNRTFYPRPDLFEYGNMGHANPFKIWSPVMTDGLRLVMGFTGFCYAKGTDQKNWERFEYYHRQGFSIAWSFAKAAMDADNRHIPMVLSQGATLTECDDIIHKERFFTSGRPGTGRYRGHYWHRLPLTYIRSIGAGLESTAEDRALAEGGALLSQSDYVYDSVDSKKTESEFHAKYLDVFGLGDATPLYEQRRSQSLYQLDGQDEARVDHGNDSFIYRNPEAYEGIGEGVRLTQSECIDRALSLLMDHEIVQLDEIELDSVISINQMSATLDEIEADTFNSEPEVVGYIAVFKRRLGNLPLLTNDVDTIEIEITTSGEIASFISNYKHGRILTQRESIQPQFGNVEDAKETLAWMGTFDEVKAGLLPLENGDYVPVYKVTMLSSGATELSSPIVRYIHQDTLEPVSFMAANTIDGYEPEEAEETPEE